MLYIISLDLLFSLNLIAKVDPMLHIAIILFFLNYYVTFYWITIPQF